MQLIWEVTDKGCPIIGGFADEEKLELQDGILLEDGALTQPSRKSQVPKNLGVHLS